MLGCDTGTGCTAVLWSRVSQVRVRFPKSRPEATPRPVTAVSRVFCGVTSSSLSRLLFTIFFQFKQFFSYFLSSFSLMWCLSQHLSCDFPLSTPQPWLRQQWLGQQQCRQQQQQQHRQQRQQQQQQQGGDNSNNNGSDNDDDNEGWESGRREQRIET